MSALHGRMLCSCSEGPSPLSGSGRCRMRALRWSLLIVLIGGLAGVAYLHWRKDTVRPVVSEVAEADLDGRAVRVTGPHSHENLTVFLVHSDTQDERDFITLDEGLEKGLVKIA